MHLRQRPSAFFPGTSHNPKGFVHHATSFWLCSDTCQLKTKTLKIFFYRTKVNGLLFCLGFSRFFFFLGSSRGFLWCWHGIQGVLCATQTLNCWELLQPTADRTWPSQLLTRPRDEKSAGILHMNHSIPIRSFSPHNYRLMHTYTFFSHMIESISFPSIMQHVQTFYQALIANSQPAPSIGMKQIGKCDNNAFLSLC